MDDRNGSLAKAAAQRPPLRSEDPRRDASERAKQIMGQLGDDFGEQADEFAIDPSVIPDGWSYEWKQSTVLGATDPSKQRDLAKTGWEPVPTSRHPEMMPPGSTERNIVRKGMQLMERPQEITDFSKGRDRKTALMQMRSKKEQLEGGAAAGAFDATNKGTPLSKVRADYGPMAIPD